MLKFFQLGCVALMCGLLLACEANGTSFGGQGVVAGDADGDGVRNAADLCPGTAPGATVDADGCAAGQTPNTDLDGDGVSNDADLCPGTAPGAVVDGNGCAAGQTPSADSDGDGVSNTADLCPDTAAGAEVDANGCAAGQTPNADEDGDGVLGSADLCPGTPAGEPVNEFGCSASQVATGPVSLNESFVCTERSTGVTSTTAEGNACLLAPVLDIVTGLLTQQDSCYVNNPDNVIDRDASTFAEMGLDVSLLDVGMPEPLASEVTLRVDLPGEKGAGRVAGFDVEIPGGTVEAALLASITIRTYLNGVLVDESSTDPSVGGNGLLTLDLLDLGLDNARFIAGFLATAPFNAVEIAINATLLSADLGVLEPSDDPSLWVYDACGAAVSAGI